MGENQCVRECRHIASYLYRPSITSALAFRQLSTFSLCNVLIKMGSETGSKRYTMISRTIKPTRTLLTSCCFVCVTCRCRKVSDALTRRGGVGCTIQTCGKERMRTKGFSSVPPHAFRSDTLTPGFEAKRSTTFRGINVCPTEGKKSSHKKFNAFQRMMVTSTPCRPPTWSPTAMPTSISLLHICGFVVEPLFRSFHY